MNRDSVNISNYEEWVIDRLDGLLSHEEEAQLDAFLLTHPELEVELEELADVQLIPDTPTFNEKSALKKACDAPSEEEVIAYVESGESSEAIRKALADEDPFVARSIALYRSIHLEADTTIGFPARASLRYESELQLVADESISYLDKESLKHAKEVILQVNEEIVYPYKELLKKKEKDGGVVIPMYVVRWAVAASIALLAGLFFMMQNGQEYSPRDKMVEFPSLNEENETIDPFASRVLATDTDIESPTKEKEPPALYSQDKTPVMIDDEVKEVAGTILASDESDPSRDRREKENQSATESLVDDIELNEEIAEQEDPRSDLEFETKQQDSWEGLTEEEEDGIASTTADDEPRVEPTVARPDKKNIPTVLEFLKEETAEQLTGDKNERIHPLDVLQRVSEETDIIAMNSNHKDDQADRKKFSIKVGGFEYRRNKRKR